MIISAINTLLWPVWICTSFYNTAKSRITSNRSWTGKSGRLGCSTMHIRILPAQLFTIFRLARSHLHIPCRSICTWVHWLARMGEAIWCYSFGRFRRKARATILVRNVLLTDAFWVMLPLLLLIRKWKIKRGKKIESQWFKLGTLIWWNNYKIKAMIPLLMPAQQWQLVQAQPLILWNSLHVLYHQMLFAWFKDEWINFQLWKQ